MSQSPKKRESWTSDCARISVILLRIFFWLVIFQYVIVIKTKKGPIFFCRRSSYSSSSSSLAFLVCLTTSKKPSLKKTFSCELSKDSFPSWWTHSSFIWRAHRRRQTSSHWIGATFQERTWRKNVTWKNPPKMHAKTQIFLNTYCCSKKNCNVRSNELKTAAEAALHFPDEKIIL